MVAAMAAVLSELDDIFTIKEGEKRALKAFVGGQNMFLLYFQPSLAKV